LGGVIIAVLVATPEAMSAVNAARSNNVQRAMNIVNASVVATMALTIPAMLVIVNITGRHFFPGLEHTDIVMLLLTLFRAASPMQAVKQMCCKAPCS
jgi:Ca2+:H+ antiporter